MIWCVWRGGSGVKSSYCSVKLLSVGNSLCSRFQRPFRSAGAPLSRHLHPHSSPCLRSQQLIAHEETAFSLLESLWIFAVCVHILQIKKKKVCCGNGMSVRKVSFWETVSDAIWNKFYCKVLMKTFLASEQECILC